MTGTIVAIIYAGAVCECRNGRDCAVLMQALVGGFGMGLADRWGRQKTIIYYSVISIIGEYRCAFLRNRKPSSRLRASSCGGQPRNDDRWEAVGRLCHGSTHFGRFPHRCI